MLLVCGLLTLTVVTVVADRPHYPTQCDVLELEDMDFMKHLVTQERIPGELVKLTFQFLPRFKVETPVDLDIRAVFHFLDNTETSGITDRTCIGLAFIHLTRLKDVYSYDVQNEPQHHSWQTFIAAKFFENFQEFDLKVRFNPSVDVGRVYMNHTCLQNGGLYSTCIESLKVAKDVATALHQKNPISEQFWESMNVCLHRRLGAQLDKLHMTFPEDNRNVLFLFLMWMLDQEHVDIYDFRMSSSKYYPNWGSLNTTYLQIMPLLTHLDLSNNGISEIQPGYLTAVTETLTFLNLGRNKLSTIPPQIYNLTKLTFLDLSRNPFHNVDSFFDVDHLTNFQHVTFFNMSHVAIKNMNHIRSLLKTGAMKLTVLDLSFCELRDFHKYPDLFSEQRSMTHLFLAGNRMIKSPRLHFGDEQQLLTIDLTFNNLTTPLHILDVGKVTNLNISMNSITDWTIHSDYLDKNLSVFGNIENLNLSVNTIPALTEDMGLSLEELQTVDIGGNPIDCGSCDISQFKKWLISYQNSNDSNKVTITLFNENVDDFNCTKPPTLKEVLVSNVTVNEILCQENGNSVIQLGVGLAALCFMLTLLGVILYVYRHEATYVLHLVKVKKLLKASGIQDEDDYIFDTFVCYSGHDRAWVVGNLLPTLKNGQQKYRLCLYEIDFILENFMKSTRKEVIKNSRRVIVVITGNFVKNQWCKWELEMANHKLFEESGEFLVLIELESLDRSIVPRYLKYLMDTRTYLEWPEPGDRTEEVEVVYSRLKEALGPSIHELVQEQMQSEDIPQREMKA